MTRRLAISLGILFGSAIGLLIITLLGGGWTWQIVVAVAVAISAVWLVPERSLGRQFAIGGLPARHLEPPRGGARGMNPKRRQRRTALAFFVVGWTPVAIVSAATDSPVWTLVTAILVAVVLMALWLYVLGAE